MNIFKKRSTIVLATFGAIGAIAAIATAASFALFYDPPAPVSQTFTTNSVTLGTPAQTTCTLQDESIGSQSSGAGAGPLAGLNPVTPVMPGYSTHGYPGNLGDQSGQVCTFVMKYTGSADAFLATDVSVSSTAGSSSIACGGGSPAACYPLYSPNQNEANDLQVWATYTVNGSTYALGIGNNQTISQPGTTDVNVHYQSAATDAMATQCQQGSGTDCPVTNGFTVTYRIYVYWPIQASADQNPYQGSQVKVTTVLHGVQAYDNPLQACSPITDSEAGGNPPTYANPDQPAQGWGSGFSTADNYSQNSGCPTVGSTAAAWVAGAPTTTLYPFSHVSTETTGSGWDLTTTKQS